MFSKLVVLSAVLAAVCAGHHQLSLSHGTGHATSSQSFSQHLEPVHHAHVHHAHEHVHHPQVHHTHEHVHQAQEHVHHPHVHHAHDHEHEHDHAPASYEYSYAVDDAHTQDQKQHKETREGGTVRGQYSFLQPDGSTRTVTYTADDTNGFQAQVSTTGGEAQQQAFHHTAGGYQHNVQH